MAVPAPDALHEDQMDHPSEVLVSVPPCQGKEPGSQGAGVRAGEVRRAFLRRNVFTPSASGSPFRQVAVCSGLTRGTREPRVPQTLGAGCALPPGTWGWPWARGACWSLRAACPFLLQGHTLPSGRSGAPAEVAGGACMVLNLDQPLPGRLA